MYTSTMKTILAVIAVAITPSIASATDICYLFQTGSKDWVECKEQAASIEQDKQQVRYFNNQMDSIIAAEKATVSAEETTRVLQLLANIQARQNGN